MSINKHFKAFLFLPAVGIDVGNKFVVTREDGA